MFFLAKIILTVFLSLSCNRLFAQTYLFFQDSRSQNYYEYSWMELTTPSELERKGSELRRFPVESEIIPHQGINCLRLSWKSVAGGNWLAIVAGNNWQDHDIREADSLTFWLYSLEGIDSTQLPKIFMEDINNVKTTKHIISNRCPDLIANLWTRISIPMNLFFNASDPVDFSKIKTVGFAQNTSEGQPHTILIDDIRVFKGNSASPAVSAPSGVNAEGFDCHVDISWNPNPETDVTGYEIHRSIDGGNTFEIIAIADKSDTYYIDWVKEFDDTLDIIYWVTALNASYDPSDPSDTVSTSRQQLSDDQLLDMVQRYTFRYYWDFAHPNSGMSREASDQGFDICATGGTGFGIMAILVGIERGFITRQEGLQHITKIVNFLQTADRFHGAWSHWIDGNTGKTIPFGPKDDGGDLVETAFLVEGLLTARQYFNVDDPDEKSLVQKITMLWEEVEWDWYTKYNSNTLYWHWSPNYGWEMNMPIKGFHEALIVYILAIASPTHAVNESLYHTGWAVSSYLNGNTYYGYKLAVGPDKSGPLFWIHYSFLGFDPRYKKDAYTNYFLNNVNWALIHRAYAIANPKGFKNYGDSCWGLTASYDPLNGYLAHDLNNDNGTISPTAAIASMPYTPEYSLGALKYFYRELGDKIWGNMGFTDAFNVSLNWYSKGYISIDQGPIIDMIENYRSGLLWHYFMANPEIQPTLDKIGFVADSSLALGYGHLNEKNTNLTIFPNPSDSFTNVDFSLYTNQYVTAALINSSAQKISTFFNNQYFMAGNNSFGFSTSNFLPGIYLLQLKTENKTCYEKLVIIK